QGAGGERADHQVPQHVVFVEKERRRRPQQAVGAGHVSAVIVGKQAGVALNAQATEETWDWRAVVVAAVAPEEAETAPGRAGALQSLRHRAPAVYAPTGEEGHYNWALDPVELSEARGGKAYGRSGSRNGPCADEDQGAGHLFEVVAGVVHRLGRPCQSDGPR